MLYIKDGQIATNIILFNGKLIINPTHDDYIRAGYSIYIPSLTNAEIRSLREALYKLRSDSYFIAWQKYLALGKEEKAAAMKQTWLDEIDKIDLEYPYNS